MQTTHLLLTTWANNVSGNGQFVDVHAANQYIAISVCMYSNCAVIMFHRHMWLATKATVSNVGSRTTKSTQRVESGSILDPGLHRVLSTTMAVCLVWPRAHLAAIAPLTSRSKLILSVLGRIGHGCQPARQLGLNKGRGIGGGKTG
jgi:hypothetical protein